MSHCQFCGGIMTVDGCDTCHVKPKKKEHPKIGVRRLHDDRR